MNEGPNHIGIPYFRAGLAPLAGCLLTCPFQPPLRTVHPKVNSWPEPVVVVLAGLKGILTGEDRFCDLPVAAMKSDERSEGIA